MNAINTSSKFVAAARKVALKFLEWRWKVNLKKAQLLVKLESKIRANASKLVSTANEVSLKADTRLEQCEAIRKAMKEV